MRFIGAFLLSVWLLAIGATQVNAQAGPEAVDSKIVPCPMGTPVGEIEGETILCGQIQVPEDWSKPEGRLLTISYARLVAKAKVPFDDPVIYFEGGPGGTALGSMLSYVQAYERLREDRDVILWDQRGTRYSSQLYCPDDARVGDMAAYIDSMSEFMEQFLAQGDPSLEDGPQAFLERQRAILEFDQVANCRTYFDQQGIDVTQYNTANTVFDTVALMKVLGAPAYNLHAISYGTTVALSLMQYYTDHPEDDLHPIRSAVVDGVYPLNYDYTNEGMMLAYNILRVFDDCEADEACAAAYPNIRQRLVDLLARLEAEPLTLADGEVLGSSELKDLLTASIVIFHSSIPYLPRMIDELERGESATYSLILSAVLSTRSLNPPVLSEEPVSQLGVGVPELTSIAISLRETASQLEVVGLEANLIREALENTQSAPEMYLFMLDRYLKLLGVSMATNLISVLEGFVAAPDEQTRGGLLSVNSNIGTPIIKRQMDRLVEGMTDEEVAQVFAGLINREFFGQLTGLHLPFLFIVNCNDRASSIDTEVAFEQYRSFAVPQLLNQIDVVAQMQAYCEALGLKDPEYAPPPSGVVSDIPTLVVNGALDMATPAESGALVMETLTNAKMLTFPGLTHGATIQSRCSVDLTYNFIMYPDRALNLSCLESLRRPFVALDDPLPELSE
ncbi:MAG: alpha/beta hydrolase [Caldilinea sp.]